jgi:hypothetical protein
MKNFRGKILWRQFMAENVTAIPNNENEKYVKDMPFRIRACLDYLHQIALRHCLKEPYSDIDLKDHEVTTQKKALECLNKYFDGEIDFGDRPPNSHHETVDINESAKKKIKEIKELLEKLESANV